MYLIYNLKDIFCTGKLIYSITIVICEWSIVISKGTYPDFVSFGVVVASRKQTAGTYKLAFDICVVDATLGRKHAVTELIKIIEKYSADTLVVGLPTNMNGTRGDRVVKTEKFTKALKEVAPDLTIVFEDERLTTKYADRLMLESGKHQKQKGVSDKLV